MSASRWRAWSLVQKFYKSVFFWDTLYNFQCLCLRLCLCLCSYFLFCLVGQNMFLSLCWLLICEDDIYWMSHNPKHTMICGSNADIPLLLMGRTLWQRVTYSNWNLNHFFSSGTSPCLVMDQHQQKCRTRFLPLQAANSLFEENFFL